jgi:hypothetical protein
VHAQKLVSVVKMGLCLIYTAKQQHSVVRFLQAKGLNAKDIHEEIFPVHSGKYLSRKAVHRWVEKLSQGLSEVTDDARLARPVEIATEATVQRVK